PPPHGLVASPRRWRDRRPRARPHRRGGEDGPGGSDRGGRLDAARLRRRRRRPWLLPAPFRRLRPRGRALPSRRLLGQDRKAGAGWAFDVLLPDLPTLAARR